METHKPKLSKVLSYTDDIEPYPFIQIYSGVGSGKNYYINKLITGHIDTRHDGSTVQIEPQTVLLITSRRAKVEEVLNEDDLPIDGKVGRWEDFHLEWHNEDGEPTEPPEKCRVLYDDWGEHHVYQRSVVCTNAFIERYMQYCYRPDDITTHLWELFDIIVVDEVHSVVMDATYQSAPFYVHELVNIFNRLHMRARKNPERYSAPSCKHVILMTGSPDPIEEFKVPEYSHTINMFDQCVNVVPKNIHFITSENAKRQIVEQLCTGEKILYFTNHVVYPEDFFKNVKTDKTIDLSSIAVSFSQTEKRDALQDVNPDLYNKMVRVEESIASCSMLPDDIHLFLTTSRNKEGINIWNRDIQYLYVESHNRSDVVQMAGRIRSGVEHMYVIVDASGHYDKEWKNEYWFSRCMSKGFPADEEMPGVLANDFLKALCKRTGVHTLEPDEDGWMQTAYACGCEEIPRYIEYIHEKFPYIRYSYVFNKFRFYGLRKRGKNYQRAFASIFERAKSNPDLYQKTLQSWFPSSTVFPYIPRNYSAEQDEAAMRYFNERGLEDPLKRYTLEEIDKIKMELNKIYGDSIKQINSLLKRFCAYKCKRVSNDKNKPQYNLYRFTIAQNDRI